MRKPSIAKYIFLVLEEKSPGSMMVGRFNEIYIVGLEKRDWSFSEMGSWLAKVASINEN